MQSLDEYFAYPPVGINGTKYLYPGQNAIYTGQCVQSVMIKISAVDGQTPPVYPDAKDYWFNGIPGYSVVTDPQRGDIAVYDGHGDFPEGHIAVVADNGQVFEQNADPDGSPMHFAVRPTTYLLGYLRYNGDIMPSTEEILQSALNAERTENANLNQSIAILESALNAARAQVAELQAAAGSPIVTVNGEPYVKQA